jgi:ribonuclease Z
MITVTMLGTGSGKPTPERNVSCTTVFRDGELILFDCGEGTQVQLTRARLRPGTIGVICISHFHGDHINGLPGLLGTLQLNQRESPLTLIGPVGIKRYLRTLNGLGVYGAKYPLHIIEVDAPGTVYEGNGYHIAADKLKHRIRCWGFRLSEPDRPGRFDVDAARQLGVPHGPMYGRLQRGETITLDDGTQVEPGQVLGGSRRGRAIAYCCDTSPCDGAIRLASGADLLIHEGTYAPNETKLAHPRGHSTMCDAARTAAAANVARLVITHISPKYLRTDPFLPEVREIFPETYIARDLNTFEIPLAD